MSSNPRGVRNRLKLQTDEISAFFGKQELMEKILFLSLLIIYLLPVWAFEYFVTADGPSHVYNASVIYNYLRPEYSSLRQYYELNSWLTTNFFDHIILAGLMFIVPAIVGEKILLSAYILILPVSIRYALSAVNQSSTFLTVLAFPFIYNYFLHEG